MDSERVDTDTDTDRDRQQTDTIYRQGKTKTVRHSETDGDRKRNSVRQ